jgi:hypothetical protein
LFFNHSLALDSKIPGLLRIASGQGDRLNDAQKKAIYPAITQIENDIVTFDQFCWGRN